MPDSIIKLLVLSAIEFLKDMTKIIATKKLEIKGFIGALVLCSFIMFMYICYNILKSPTEYGASEIITVSEASIGGTSDFDAEEILPEVTVNYSIEDIIILSKNRIFSEEELCDFTRNELRYIRNGIFAFEGRRFIEEDLRNYYFNFKWYQPVPEGVVVDYMSLNYYQRKNVLLIKNIEKYK